MSPLQKGVLRRCDWIKWARGGAEISLRIALSVPPGTWDYYVYREFGYVSIALYCACCLKADNTRYRLLLSEISLHALHLSLVLKSCEKINWERSSRCFSSTELDQQNHVNDALKHISLSLRPKHGHSMACSSTTVIENRLFSLVLKKLFFGGFYFLFQSYEIIHCSTFTFLFLYVLQHCTILFSFKTQGIILGGDSSVVNHYFCEHLSMLLDSVFETTGLWLFILLKWCGF